MGREKENSKGIEFENRKSVIIGRGRQIHAPEELGEGSRNTTWRVSEAAEANRNPKGKAKKLCPKNNVK